MKTIELRDKTDVPRMFIEVKNLHKSGFEGVLREAKGTDEVDGVDVLIGVFISSFSVKWDSCSHFNFYGSYYGSDEEEKEINAYYHLCGLYSYIDFMRGLAFITEVAKEKIGIADFEQADYETIQKLNLLDGYTIVYK